MKKSIIALVLACVLALSGCSTMLERDYLAVTTYEPISTSSAGSANLRVESYQELVNAVLYLVSAGEEQGVLSLYNYTTQDLEADLARACLEVVQEDPLGAYAVDYIRHDYSLIVSYYEVNINITYRRTPEQVASIVSVTGSSAIRRELYKTLSSFSSAAVLRVSYFAENEDYILDLVRQAYYDAPSSALGMPEVSISIYPDTGDQRIVEIGLIYPEDPNLLLYRSQEVKELARLLTPVGSSHQDLYHIVLDGLTVEEGSGRSTAYDALANKTADSEGLALAYQLLCDQAGLDCMVVRGELDGRAHLWNLVSEDGLTYRHADLSAGLFALTDDELTQAGAYEWDRGEYPACDPPASDEEVSQENLI